MGTKKSHWKMVSRVCDLAESVLDIHGSRRPDGFCPRQAVGAARAPLEASAGAADTGLFRPTATRRRCRSSLVLATPATASPGVPFFQFVAHKPLRSSAISALKMGDRGVMGDTTPGEPGAI